MESGQQDKWNELKSIVTKEYLEVNSSIEKINMEITSARIKINKQSEIKDDRERYDVTMEIFEIVSKIIIAMNEFEKKFKRIQMEEFKHGIQNQIDEITTEADNETKITDTIEQLELECEKRIADFKVKEKSYKELQLQLNYDINYYLHKNLIPKFEISKSEVEKMKNELKYHDKNILNIMGVFLAIFSLIGINTGIFGSSNKHMTANEIITIVIVVNLSLVFSMGALFTYINFIFDRKNQNNQQNQKEL